MISHLPTPRRLTAASICALALLSVAPIRAEPAVEVHLTYANGAFQPSEVRAPANKPVVFRVKNLDAKAMEFESTSLRVEKVVPSKAEGIVNVRPLQPGRYQFYDDFNQKARGVLTVQ